MEWIKNGTGDTAEEMGKENAGLVKAHWPVLGGSEVSELSTVRMGGTGRCEAFRRGLDFHVFILTLIGPNKNFWEDAHNVADKSLERAGEQSCVARGKEVGGGYDHRGRHQEF